MLISYWGKSYHAIPDICRFSEGYETLSTFPVCCRWRCFCSATRYSIRFRPIGSTRQIQRSSSPTTQMTTWRSGLALAWSPRTIDTITCQSLNSPNCNPQNLTSQSGPNGTCLQMEQEKLHFYRENLMTMTQPPNVWRLYYVRWFSATDLPSFMHFA